MSKYHISKPRMTVEINDSRDFSTDPIFVFSKRDQNIFSKNNIENNLSSVDPKIEMEKISKIGNTYNIDAQ